MLAGRSVLNEKACYQGSVRWNCAVLKAYKVILPHITSQEPSRHDGMPVPVVSHPVPVSDACKEIIKASPMPNTPIIPSTRSAPHECERTTTTNASAMHHVLVDGVCKYEQAGSRSRCEQE